MATNKRPRRKKSRTRIPATFAWLAVLACVLYLIPYGLSIGEYWNEPVEADDWLVLFAFAWPFIGVAALIAFFSGRGVEVLLLGDSIPPPSDPPQV